MNMAYAVFDDDQLAARAVDALVQHDFTMADICVLLRATPASEALGAAVAAAGGALGHFGSSDLLAAGAGSLMIENAAPVPHDRLTRGAVIVGVLSEDGSQIDTARSILEHVGAPEVQVRAPLESSEEVEQFDQAEADRRIDEALVQSFPASDPPAGWSGPPRPAPDKR